jgi:hypothetical protein
MASWQVGFYKGGQLLIRGRPPIPIDTAPPPTGGFGVAPFGTAPFGQ